MTDGFDALNSDRPIPDSIYALLGYDNDSQHLGNDLRLLGYDLIIVNFPLYPIGPFPSYVPILPPVYYSRDGGADLMERNALTMEKLIMDINTEVANNTAPGTTPEKLVIVGPSMGGQITRYALKDMENKGVNHNTRLWIAFDSPNHGANIPVGL
jgi:hypothetical protein